MQPHMVLHQKSPLQKHHFETWLSYFNEPVDELFEGEKASLAKERALIIATVMQIKIKQLSWIVGEARPSLFHKNNFLFFFGTAVCNNLIAYIL